MPDQGQAVRPPDLPVERSRMRGRVDARRRRAAEGRTGSRRRGRRAIPAAKQAETSPEAGKDDRGATPDPAMDVRGARRAAALFEDRDGAQVDRGKDLGHEFPPFALARYWKTAPQ